VRPSRAILGPLLARKRPERKASILRPQAGPVGKERKATRVHRSRPRRLLRLLSTCKDLVRNALGMY
jgi:hypothetical protein